MLTRFFIPYSKYKWYKKIIFYKITNFRSDYITEEKESTYNSHFYRNRVYLYSMNHRPHIKLRRHGTGIVRHFYINPELRHSLRFEFQPIRNRQHRRIASGRAQVKFHPYLIAVGHRYCKSLFCTGTHRAEINRFPVET